MQLHGSHKNLVVMDESSIRTSPMMILSWFKMGQGLRFRASDNETVFHPNLREDDFVVAMIELKS